MTISWVGRDRLGDLAAHRLGDGGQGVVYAVPDPPGKFAGEYLAYKEYLPSVASDAEVLYQLVCFFDELGRTVRHDHAFLDKRLTWPTALVYTGARPTQPSPRANPGTTVTGFLMQRITEEFELDSTRLGKVKPQGMEFLLNDDGFTASLGLDVDDGRRLRLLIDLAATLNRLHRHGVTVGDLSPKNVLFMLDPSPKCLLIDCDSMRLKGRDVLPQVETDDWAVPEQAKATPASDVYKFGLITTRLFNRDQSSTDLSELRNVSSGLANLAERSRVSDPRRRPSVEEWLQALEQARVHLKQRKQTQRQQAQAQTQTHTRTHTPPRSQQPTQTRTRPNPQGRPPRQPSTPPPTPSPPPYQGPLNTPGRPRAATPYSQPTTTTPPYSRAPAQPPRPTVPGLSAAARSFAVVVALLLLVGLGLTAAHYIPAIVDSFSDDSSTSGDNSVRSGPGLTDAPEPSDEPDPPDRAEAPGATVDFSQVADHPRARGVATMFAHFYGAINEGDYDKAMRRYDPHSKVVNINSAESRAGWTEVMSTTRESDIALTGVSHDGTYTLATVGFRSEQDPGYGPASNPDETCTDWTITYQLTNTKGYRILKAPREGVNHSPC